MLSANLPTGYSSTVKLELIVNDQAHPLGSVGPDYITLREPLELAPCDARIAMTIDSQQTDWPVRLPMGCRADSDHVAVEKVGGSAGR